MPDTPKPCAPPVKHPTIWAHIEGGELVNADERIGDLCCSPAEAVRYEALVGPPVVETSRIADLESQLTDWLLIKNEPVVIGRLAVIKMARGEATANEPPDPSPRDAFLLALDCVERLAKPPPGARQSSPRDYARAIETLREEMGGGAIIETCASAKAEQAPCVPPVVETSQACFPGFANYCPTCCWLGFNSVCPNGCGTELIHLTRASAKAEQAHCVVRSTSTVAYLSDGTRITIDRGDGSRGPRLAISRPEVFAVAQAEQAPGQPSAELIGKCPADGALLVRRLGRGSIDILMCPSCGHMSNQQSSAALWAKLQAFMSRCQELTEDDEHEAIAELARRLGVKP